jgi:hypothetical protein
MKCAWFFHGMRKHDARKLDHATLEALRERAVQLMPFDSLGTCCTWSASNFSKTRVLSLRAAHGTVVRRPPWLKVCSNEHPYYRSGHDAGHQPFRKTQGDLAIRSLIRTITGPATTPLITADQNSAWIIHPPGSPWPPRLTTGNMLIITVESPQPRSHLGNAG